MTVVDALRAVVGTAHVLVDDDLRAGHEVDWTGRYRGRGLAVVRPADHDEVARVLRVCRDHGVPFVTQGGNTGLVGGSVPDGSGGAIVLLTTRLTDVVVDERAGVVRAGAGATVAAVQQAATAAGWRYGVDFAARDTATIGGSVATNAGGLRVVRHGTTRHQLLGIRAVLADGTEVDHRRGLVKDNTGFDLVGLLCGSEGTLGVITEVVARLVAPAGEAVTALVGLADVDAAVALVADARRHVPTLEAAELVFADGAALVAEHVGHRLPRPTESPVCVVLEAVGSPDPTAALAALVDRYDALATAVAADAAGRAELWLVRERHTEAIGAQGVPHKLDVTIPASAVSTFCAEVDRAIARTHPEARRWIFGHLGDGNLHVNVVGPDPDDPTVDDAVLGAVVDHGGSISAEHGVGRAKRRWLDIDRAPGDLAAMRAIRRALDPGGLANPGVLFTPDP